MDIDISKVDQINSWPFQEAKLLSKKINKKPEKGYVLFQTGFGASGLPHIGTFGEVFRTQMVMNIFNKISDMPTKLVVFSDDYDALRKVPNNLPNQDMLKENLGKPVSSIPDPFKEYKSFAENVNSKLKNFKSTGKRIALYGSGHIGSSFINYFDFIMILYCIIISYTDGNCSYSDWHYVQRYSQ